MNSAVALNPAVFIFCLMEPILLFQFILHNRDERSQKGDRNQVFLKFANKTMQT